MMNDDQSTPVARVKLLGSGNDSDPDPENWLNHVQAWESHTEG